MDKEKETKQTCQNQTSFEIMTGFKEVNLMDGGCGSSCSRQKNA